MSSGPIAWLLCGLLACAAIHSPHCNLCDEFDFAGFSSPHAAIADQLHPAAQDDCNGTCSCCLLRALPQVTVVLSTPDSITTGVWIASSSPVQAPRRSLLRPPRPGISS